MKTLSVADLKAQFSSVISDLRQGNEVVITYGRNKQPIATIVPQDKLAKPNYAIDLGDLKAQGWSYQLTDFALHDEDLIGP